MPTVYFEKQVAGLCGVHCLNTLLQGPYFTAVDLMRFASELDEKERQTMLEMGADTNDFLRYMAEESGNVSDDGNYSIQVLSEALKVWSVDPVVMSKTEIGSGKRDVCEEEAFICNLRNHWFSIRKIDGEFYDFNSLYERPRHVSGFYLSAFLQTLQLEGYTIFVVRSMTGGQLPRGDPLSMSSTGSGVWVDVHPRQGGRSGARADDRGSRATIEDEMLQKALKESLRAASAGAPPEPGTPMDAEEDELAQAIAMSLAPGSPAKPADQSGERSGSSGAMEVEEENSACGDEGRHEHGDDGGGAEADDELQDAIALSLSPGTPTKADPAPPPPPPDGTPGELLTRIAVRLPTGERCTRTFLRSSTIHDVFEFVRSQSPEMVSVSPTTHQLSQALPPAVYDDPSSTLEHYGLFPSVQVTLRERR